jgi:hypothetical protein
METVRRVVKTCERIDKDASVLNYTVCNNVTVVRLRSNGGEDATSKLAKKLGYELPFSRTAVTKNLLDGSLETTIEIAGPEHERLSARVYASAGRLPSALRALSTLLVVAGAALFLVGLGLVAKRHLSYQFP